MVFSRGEGAVASVSQDLAKRHRVSHLAMRLIHAALLARILPLASRPWREALSRVVHLRESNAILGQLIDVRRINFASVATEIGPAHVIYEYKDDIWSIVREGTEGSGNGCE